MENIFKYLDNKTALSLRNVSKRFRKHFYSWKSPVRDAILTVANISALRGLDLSKLPVAYPMIYACKAGNTWIVRALNSRVASDTRALGFIIACASGNLTIARFLHPYVTVCESQTYIAKRAYTAHIELPSKLCEYIQPCLTLTCSRPAVKITKVIDFAIAVAAKHGQLNVLSAFLNSATYVGIKVAAEEAALNNHVNLFRAFNSLVKGICAHAYVAAARLGHTGVIAFLARYVNLDTVGYAIREAVISDNTSIIRYFVVNYKSLGLNFTQLEMALDIIVCKDKLEAFRIIAPRISKRRLKTACAKAANHGAVNIIKHLSKLGYVNDKILYILCSNNHLLALEYLFSIGFRISDSEYLNLYMRSLNNSIIRNYITLFMQEDSIRPSKRRKFV